MRLKILAPAISLAAVLAAPASAALSDFRLPGQTTQQQPPTDRQGPVAPDVPESQRPLPTPTPTAREPAQTPTPTIVLPDLPQPTSESTSPRTAPRPAATRLPAPTDTAAPTADAATPEAAATPNSFGLPAAAATPSPLPSSAPASAPSSEDEDSSIWPWVLGALATLGGLALGAWAWQRRRSAVGPSAVPEIQRPRLARAPADATAESPPQPLPAAAASVARAEPLQMALDPLRLSLTLMNATLAYRLEVTNRSTAPIVGLGIGADMIAAHASMTREQQLSGPGADATTVQRIERLEPGESRIVAGEFRVPFTQIVPIRQGNAALLLPLARFRLTAEGAAPVVRTFAVGQPGANRGLQPFRLDLGPRVYPQLAQRAFA